MKAVILAAGEGKRMRPLTHSRPKVMLPVAGKPILEHLVIQLHKAGIEGCVVVTGYHEDKVRTHLEDGKKWGIQIEYVRQEERRGTADALRVVQELSLIHI